MAAGEATTESPAVVVAGHLCLDVIPALSLSDPIEPGRLIQVGPPRFTTGGAVGNTGLALHRLGAAVRLVGCAGDDQFGQIVRTLVESQRVDHTILQLPGPTSYSIVISPPGVDRSFLHCPGVNDVLSPEQITDDLLHGARWLHFGYPPAMRKTCEDGGARLADLFQRARRLGLITSLDMCGVSPSGPASRVDWPVFFDRVLPHVDCFTPSYDELSVMLGRDGRVAPTHTTLSELTATMLARGCGFVVIKLGNDGLFGGASRDAHRLTRISGAWATHAGRTFNEPCFQVEINGTTAAGDSTIAGLIAGILDGESIPAVLKTATAVGACCVEHTDGVLGIPVLGHIRRRVAAGWPKRASRIQQPRS